MATSAKAILEVMEQLLAAREAAGEQPYLWDGARLIAKELNKTPAEVLMVLKTVHRQGKVGLSQTVNLMVTVTRSQEEQATITAAIGSHSPGAQSAKPRQEEAGVDEHESAVAQLRSTITELERELRKVTKARDALAELRRQADTAKEAVQTKLTQAQQTIRQQGDQIAELESKVAKMADLEKRLAEMQKAQSIPPDIAFTIATLVPKE